MCLLQRFWEVFILGGFLHCLPDMSSEVFNIYIFRKDITITNLQYIRVSTRSFFTVMLKATELHEGIYRNDTGCTGSGLPSKDFMLIFIKKFSFDICPKKKLSTLHYNSEMVHMTNH